MEHDKKIGILTLHSGYNEGGILQAFCLASNLQSSLINSRVEIIDHRYPNKVRAYGPVRDDKTRVMHDFVDSALPLSTKRFVSDDHMGTFQCIKDDYDAVVTGSDELWKLKYTKRYFGLLYEQKDPWCPPFPNVYWPDESIRIPKIAYAVSVGSTDWRIIPQKHTMRMKRILSQYSLLGVRDQRTMSFLEWLDANIADKAEWVPDPTFSIDLLSFVDRESLKQKLQRWGVDFNRPRICTVLRSSPELHDDIIKEVKKKGFQVVSLSLPNSIADVDLSHKGFTPLEWFGVFGLMDICITQRMHTCISCILQNTPFIAVDFYNNSLDDDTKMKDLMRSFDLLDYHYQVGKDSAGKFHEICENLINNRWPVTEIVQKRHFFHNRSKEFTEKIRMTLKDAVNT